ncbi:MAG TPA: hypothetical protein VN633_02730 [Bryobacteraceae bacterium]|nr:hypothetical protein [Bryobacteraceae bacterium]
MQITVSLHEVAHETMKEDAGIMSEIEAFHRILEIVKDERKLERHQCEKEQFGAIQQSKAFAFEEILKVLDPFLAKAQGA